MEIIAESNDLIHINFVMVFLRDAGLDPVLYDSNMTAMLGTCAFPQRIAVPPTQALSARRALKEANLA